MHFLDSHWLNAGQCIWYLPHLKQTFTSTFVFSFLSPMFTNVHQCLPLHRWCSLYTWCALLPFLPSLSLLDWITVSHRMVAWVPGNLICTAGKMLSKFSVIHTYMYHWEYMWRTSLGSVQPERYYLGDLWYIYVQPLRPAGICTAGKIFSWFSVTHIWTTSQSVICTTGKIFSWCSVQLDRYFLWTLD